MSNTGINIQNMDIINFFQPYTTGQKQNIDIFTNGNLDIGEIFEPYTSGPQHLVGIYINDNIDIGTLFQAGYLSGLTVKIYNGYFGDSTVNGGVNSEVVTYDNGKQIRIISNILEMDQQIVAIFQENCLIYTSAYFEV